MRFLPLIALLAGCTPALTMMRLSPPRAALAARTVHLTVATKGTDEVVDEPVKVSEQVLRAFSAQLVSAGYTVCPTAPCGEGVLELSISEATFSIGPPPPETAQELKLRLTMEAAFAQAGFTATKTTGDKANVKLNVGVALKEPDGKTTFARTFSQKLNEQGKPLKAVVKQAVEGAAKSFGELLSPREQLLRIQLEGGGPLNAGVELLHKGEFARAAEIFAEVTRAQPQLDGAWYDLGFALQAQGQWKAALEAYRAPEERDPKKQHYKRAASTADAVLRGVN